jgi:hypothetical protein
VRGPVQRAEKCAGGQGRVGRGEGAGADAAGDQSANAALVAIAFGDHRGAQPFRQHVEFKVRGRALHVVDQAEHVRGGEPAQAVDERRVAAACLLQRRQQAIEGPVLAEVEQFVLALEVVIQIARRQIGGDGDLAHAGGGEAAVAKDPRRRPQDRDPPRIGAA